MVILYKSFEQNLITHKLKTLFIIFLLALALRIIFHNSAMMVEPVIRGDAVSYMNTAINLICCGVYSYDAQEPLSSSNLLMPGYPLFLTAIHYLVGDISQTIKAAFGVQLVLSALVPVFTFLLSIRFLPAITSLIASLLVCIYPHQISAPSYLLTETLFGLVLIVSIYFLFLSFEKKNLGFFMACCFFFCWATLIRPIAFLICPFLLFFIWRKWSYLIFKLSGISIAVLLVYFSWAFLASHLADKEESNLRAVIVLGSYPDFTYIDVKGFPNQEDPRYSESLKSWNNLLSSIKNRFNSDPVKHISWYLIGKPVSIWSFNLVQNQGGPFIHPVESSIYDQSGLFSLTYYFLEKTHQPIAILTLLFALYTVITSLFLWVKQSELHLTVLSALMVYVSLFHIPLASLPRFSIPFQPFMIILAITAIYHLIGIFRKKTNDSTACYSND